MIIIITTTIAPITPPAIPPTLLPLLALSPPPLSLSSLLSPLLSLSLVLDGIGDGADEDVDSGNNIIDIVDDGNGVAVRDVIGDDVVVDVTSVTVGDNDEVFSSDIVVVDDNDDDVPESC